MVADSAPVDERSLWRLRLRFAIGRVAGSWKLFSRSSLGLTGLAIISFFGLLALSHPVLMATVWTHEIYDPVVGFDGSMGHPSPPSVGHLLGTDPFGRDTLSMLMFSTKSEFVLGIYAATVTVAVATTIGAVSAYLGGWTDALLMRIADIVIMMPGFSLLIVLGTLFELNFLTLAIAVGLISGLGSVAVIMRSQAMTVMVRPYVEASRGAGGGHHHIIYTHVIPNLVPMALLFMMFTVTNAIFNEAVLSYFGLLNIRMSWGIMINGAASSGYLAMGLDYWWLLVPASASITLLCGSFYLVGRGLDPLVNPRLRTR